MKEINFKSEKLIVDWITLNIEGLTDGKIIADRLLGHFKSSVLVEGEGTVEYSGTGNAYSVFLRPSTKNWVGTQVIFSGVNGAYFYKLIKTGELDWSIFNFEGHTVRLGRIDLCFCKSNDSGDGVELFDDFLVDTRNLILNHTSTRHIKLQDFPDGKMLKINRRNNAFHYRVYQKNLGVRFELEFKHRQTKLVQKYLFQNEFDLFEYELVFQYFKYSAHVLRLDYPYTDWILDFTRRYQLANSTYPSLLSSYLGSEKISGREKEERFFHLLQFLSFMKSLQVNPFTDCEILMIKEQAYYGLKFNLSQFIEFTGIQLSRQNQRDKLIRYFRQLQELGPIVKEFSDGGFRSYVCFPYVHCENKAGKPWVIEVFAAEELFAFLYPFQMPKSFLKSAHKNDLRVKLWFMKSLAVSQEEKILDFEKFFSRLNVDNTQLVEIKKIIIALLKELVEDKIVRDEIKIVFKSGREENKLITLLTTSEITRRIEHIKLNEILSKL